ncbi:hypothetical protein SD074_21300 [Prolixibacter sp. SD074]|nr:hypothetical protein SD074_21300 [Prolixibacter sp. SD074]
MATTDMPKLTFVGRRCNLKTNSSIKGMTSVTDNTHETNIIIFGTSGSLYKLISSHPKYLTL